MTRYLPFGYIVKFGAYRIDPYIAGYNLNTGSSTSGATSLYGISGANPDFRNRQNPKTPGLITVTVGMKTHNKNAPDYQRQLRELDKLANQGLQTLWYAPNGTHDPMQWLRISAKCIANDESRSINDPWHQSRQLQFEVYSPYWKARRKLTDFYLDDGEVIGDALTLADEDVESLSVGGSFTVYNDGTADALPTLNFDRNGGTLGDFQVARVDDDGNVIESFTYAGTLDSGNDQLIVNAEQRTCTDLANLTIGTGQVDFMSLPPGVSTIKLVYANTFSGEPRVYINFDYTYHA